MFDQNLCFVAENHVYKHRGDVFSDIILMPQFLEVVRQHILDLVAYWLICIIFCITLIGFSSSEKILNIT